ncbi:hypothetical protein [Pseudomonas sp. S2_A05]
MALPASGYRNSAGQSGWEIQNPLDPDAIGYAAPAHFQILMFTDYVENLMAWGDWYYRQLTRDSLVAAKLCYVQAGFLMGKAPTADTATRWQTDTVENLLDNCESRPLLEALEKTLDFNLADYPIASDTPPILGLLACEPFRIPINQSLLDLFAKPQQRLDNLRNNLTIDGKPLDVLLFSPMTDPGNCSAIWPLVARPGPDRWAGAWWSMRIAGGSRSKSRCAGYRACGISAVWCCVCSSNATVPSRKNRSRTICSSWVAMPKRYRNNPSPNWRRMSQR